MLHVGYGFPDQGLNLYSLLWEHRVLATGPPQSSVKNPPASAGDIRDAGSILGSGRPAEEGMATHSSILAWRIPWTGEPGRLQSMGLQRVGHD